MIESLVTLEGDDQADDFFFAELTISPDSIARGARVCYFPLVIQMTYGSEPFDFPCCCSCSRGARGSRVV